MTRRRWPSLLALDVVTIVCLGLATSSHRVYGQCSDAGVCSVGGAGSEERAPMVTFGGGLGSADGGSFSYYDLGIGLTVPIGTSFEASGSLPIRSTKGPLGTASGIGDLLLTVGASIIEAGAYRVRFDAGVRLATGAVNRAILPQAYQPGLGTNDLLVGVAVLGEYWNAGIGYQWSPARSDNSVDRLRRGDDLSVRGGMQIPGAPWDLTAEVIAIQRLRRSVVQRLNTDPLLMTRSIDVEVADTDRLQINALVRASVEISEQVSLHPQVAMALLKRPVNLDGLTRSFSFVIEGSVRL
jgi:hypothetical protein